MIITHHGMYRWMEQTMTGIFYERTKKLFDHDICLYSSHLPLDAHGEVGNNIWLIQAWINIFGLNDITPEPFGDYKWTPIGYALRMPTPLPVAAILTPYAEHMWLVKEFYNFWNLENISSVAIVSGWAGDIVSDAKKQWYDLFVTWEMMHHQLTLSKELWQTILLWGHYETEKIWPKLLAHHLNKKFDVEVVYLDEKY